MKKIILSFAIIALWLFSANAQNLAINADGSKPDANAILDVKSNNKGILIPRMSSAERLAIPATKGLLVYDLNTNSFWFNNGAEWKSMAPSALAAIGPWELTGNSGTDTSNFLGTTDNVPLYIRVNNISSGRIDHTNFNAFWGYGAGKVTTGAYNTGIGHEALTNNTSGYSNTALGRFALRMNTTGQSNTAVGMDALTANTTGTRNTALGMLTLLSNTTGKENTAIGFDALRSNVSGGGNVAIGTTAMYKNVQGINNTSIGASSLYANVGSDNTSVGHTSMHTNTLGSYNTGMGSLCMWLASEGSYNVAMGYRALLYNSSGDGNVAIGYDALRGTNMGSWNTAVGAESGTINEFLTNTTALGYGASVDVSNKVRIGNSAVTVIEGQVPFTTPSDGRYKFNVEEDVKGIDFIMQLRPVTYQFDVKRFDGKASEKASMQEAYTEAEKIRRTGFIAQEVEQAAVATGYNFSGVIKPKKEGDHYSLSYDAFVVPLVKAMQEQQQVIESQNKKISDLQQQLDEIKKLLQQKK